MDRRINNQKGFSLIEALIVAAVMATVAITMGTLLIEQRKATAFLEDKVEKIQMTRTIESLLLNNVSCDLNFQGLALPSVGSTLKIGSFKDSSGANIYQSNSVQNFINIGQLELRNVSISAPNTTGTVAFLFPMTRVRSGGGPSTFGTYTSLVSVRVDAANKIISCANTPTLKVLESGDVYDGQTGDAACKSLGMKCAYMQSFNNIQGDLGCPGATHCMRVCMTWYNQSLPAVPNSSSYATDANNDIHSCSAKIGYYQTYVDPGVVICGAYFSAICI